MPIHGFSCYGSLVSQLVFLIPHIRCTFAKSCSASSEVLRSSFPWDFSEILTVSLKRVFCPPLDRSLSSTSPQNMILGSLWSGIQTCPAHRVCECINRVSVLGIPTLLRTTVSGILPCHLMFMTFMRQTVWKWLRFFAERLHPFHVFACMQLHWKHYYPVHFQFCLQTYAASMPNIWI